MHTDATHTENEDVTTDALIELAARNSRLQRAKERIEVVARRIMTLNADLTAAFAELDEAMATRTDIASLNRHARTRALYARGLSDEEIAAELGVTIATVSVYRRACGLPARRS